MVTAAAIKTMSIMSLYLAIPEEATCSVQELL